MGHARRSALGDVGDVPPTRGGDRGREGLSSIVSSMVILHGTAPLTGVVDALAMVHMINLVVVDDVYVVV